MKLTEEELHSMGGGPGKLKDLSLKIVSLDKDQWRRNTEEESKREAEILSRVIDAFIPRRMPLGSH